jgi:hypothetical protein
MTSHELSGQDLTSMIEEIFAALIARGEIDIEPGDVPDDLEIQADQWTVALTGDPPSVAFLAVDDEPADASEMSSAIRGVFEPDDLEALRALDHHLDGGLRVALEQSGDLLSIELATLLAEAPQTQV